MLNDRDLDQVDIEVDGGINTSTVGEVVSAGANVLVVGSCIFNSQASVAENVAALRDSMGE
jgi:ribulose-phosphate 3-epimerase